MHGRDEVLPIGDGDTKRLPIGRTVTLDVKTTDRHGRLVAEVLSDSTINLAMVEDGQAFAYRASRRRTGVGQVEGGITRPWDFRRGRRA